MIEDYLPSIEEIYTFQSKKWKSAGLTHSSLPNGSDFERLEFVGDRILGAVLADWVYQTYPDAREGELSKLSSSLVSREQCTRIAKKIGLANVLKCASRIDLKRSSVLGNALEAWIGAIYQDGGFDAVREVVLRLWNHVDESASQDYKTKLQEWVQAQYLPLPAYKITDAQGPEHQCTYTVEVYVESIGVASGQGSSRKKAEHEAARHFLQNKGLL